jgi:HEAT repeat protein
VPRRPWIAVLAVLLLGATPAPSRADEDPWAARPVEDWVTDLGATAAPSRVAAARAIFRVAPSHPEVEAPLRRALDDPDAEVRLAAIQALRWRARSPEAAPRQLGDLPEPPQPGDEEK